MGTVDFWVPVNRHRREPGGPHDTIISTMFSPLERAASVRITVTAAAVRRDRTPLRRAYVA